MKLGLTLVGVLALFSLPTRADTFGTFGNEFTIDFVTIGNAGNADDAGAGGGLYEGPYGGVAYAFRIGTYEIPQNAIDRATASGLTECMTGPWTGSAGAADAKWYEAAAFVNWLNTSTGHQPAYNMIFHGEWIMSLWSPEESWDNDQGPGVDLNRYRHKNAWYFLPSEDEWYKAAYHKNDGVTANYWDYAKASNAPPDGIDFNGDTAFEAVFEQGFINWDATDVRNVGLPSAYGTFGQNGHLWEWFESAFDGGNDSPTELRGYRGGDLDSSEYFLRPSSRISAPPGGSYAHLGFRVASIAPDTDSDGVPDPYETSTGVYVSPVNTGTQPTESDSDGDGFGDGFEVATGFDPTSAVSTPDVVSTVLMTIPTEVQFRFNAANGISYRIEASTDLVNWPTIETDIFGTGGFVTRFYEVEGEPRRFFRARRN